MAIPKVDDGVLDAALNDIKNNCDQQSLCSQEPLTFYEAVDPAVWAATTAYSLGDVVRPSTRDGNAYECTTAGTSGASEPTWDTGIGNTTADGTVVWTARNNYSLAAAAMVAGDYTVQAGDVDGREVAVSAQNGETVHTTGTAAVTAHLDQTNKILKLVHDLTDQALTAGNTVNLGAHDYRLRAPTTV